MRYEVVVHVCAWARGHATAAHRAVIILLEAGVRLRTTTELVLVRAS